MVIRDAAQRRAKGDAELHEALGVGDELKSTDTTAVLAALAAVVKLGARGGSGLRRIGTHSRSTSRRANMVRSGHKARAKARWGAGLAPVS